MKTNSTLFTGLLLFLLASCTPSDPIQQGAFFKVEGQNILDQHGELTVIRGVGLGGWLMPEGYMFSLSGTGVNSPTIISDTLASMIGAAKADQFWDLYTKNYVQEKDIQKIAEWGYDHIRLPFHYKVLYDLSSGSFKEEGFDLFDQFLGWCRKYGLYVILDMHAAPGAQNHHNIADSDGTARLWTEPEKYWPITIKIWEEIARRYKDDKLIIGYDIINEPVLPKEVDISDLRDFFVQATAAIRAIDQNHILFIEGDRFATRFDGLQPPMDDNMVWAFHKYWNATALETIQYMLDFREETNRPLWLGESGENNNQWFYEVTRMCEENNIGWNWWTHKKVNTITAPLSAPINPDYAQIISYLRGEQPHPEPEVAERGWMELAADLHIDSCDFRPDVLDALFRDAHGETSVPYTNLKIPGILDAVHFDMGSQAVAYFDADPINESGRPGSMNRGRQFRNDGVDILKSEDEQGPKFGIGWIEGGEWLKYTINAESGEYAIGLRVAAEQGGGMATLFIDGAEAARVDIPSTGGFERWKTIPMGKARFGDGKHELRLLFNRGGFNLNQIRIQ